MKQIGLHESWLNFLYEYVSPLQERVFIGYNTNVRVIKNRIYGNRLFIGCTTLFTLIYKLMHRYTNVKLEVIVILWHRFLSVESFVFEFVAVSINVYSQMHMQ